MAFTDQESKAVADEENGLPATEQKKPHPMNALASDQVFFQLTFFTIALAVVLMWTTFSDARKLNNAIANVKFPYDFDAPKNGDAGELEIKTESIPVDLGVGLAIYPPSGFAIEVSGFSNGKVAVHFNSSDRNPLKANNYYFGFILLLISFISLTLGRTLAGTLCVDILASPFYLTTLCIDLSLGVNFLVSMAG
jgi:hypothetical protein